MLLQRLVAAVLERARDLLTARSAARRVVPGFPVHVGLIMMLHEHAVEEAALIQDAIHSQMLRLPQRAASLTVLVLLMPTSIVVLVVIFGLMMALLSPALDTAAEEAAEAAPHLLALIMYIRLVLTRALGSLARLI